MNDERMEVVLGGRPADPILAADYDRLVWAYEEGRNGAREAEPTPARFDMERSLLDQIVAYCTRIGKVPPEFHTKLIVGSVPEGVGIELDAEQVAAVDRMQELADRDPAEYMRRCRAAVRPGPGEDERPGEDR